MKTFKMKHGHVASVDDDSYELLSQYNWCVSVNGYVVARDKVSGKVIYMHRLIMGNPVGLLVDHRDTKDRLNNQRSNLRICSNAENAKNQKIRSNNTSGFKGVSWNTKRLQWEAYIKSNYKRKFLGYFSDKLDAARAYNEAALEDHGEFARLNEVPNAY